MSKMHDAERCRFFFWPGAALLLLQLLPLDARFLARSFRGDAGACARSACTRCTAGTFEKRATEAGLQTQRTHSAICLHQTFQTESVGSNRWALAPPAGKPMTRMISYDDTMMHTTQGAKLNPMAPRMTNKRPHQQASPRGKRHRLALSHLSKAGVPRASTTIPPVGSASLSNAESLSLSPVVAASSVECPSGRTSALGPCRAAAAAAGAFIATHRVALMKTVVAIRVSGEEARGRVNSDTTRAARGGQRVCCSWQ